MAFKENTFWKEHPPIAEPRTEPDDRGMAMESAFSWFAVSWVLCAFYMGTVYLIAWPRPVDFDTFLIAFFLVWPVALPIAIVAEEARRGYRLVADGAWVEGHDAIPRSQVALLRHVLVTPSLFDRLGPPQSGRPHRFWHVVTEWPRGTAMSVAMELGTCAFIIAWVRLAHVPVLYLALLGVFLILARNSVLVYRVKQSVRNFGTGTETHGATETGRYRFEDVTGASLHVDPWLLRLYLRLDVGDRTLRYYNPTDDGLYLLRVVRHRIPARVLQA